MYSVEFALHIRYKHGWATFRKEDQLPFPPFIGLVILDDAVGEFTLDLVAWHGPTQSFLCQSQSEMKAKSLRQVSSLLRTALWIEDKDARELVTKE